MAEVGRAAHGGSRPGTPVRPPRRGTSPGPAAAPAATRRPHRDGWLWLLVAAVALAGIVVVASIAGSEPTPGTLSPSPTTTPVTTPPRDVPGGWSEVARGFGLAFTRTAPGHDAWFAAMSSWLTPEQADRYRDVPVGDIPTGTLREIAVDDPGGRRTTRGRLTYDTGMVLELGLTYVEAAGSWLVARVTLSDPET